jgi:hypothetical protein
MAMKRRQALKDLLAGGAASGALASIGRSSAVGSVQTEAEPLVEKVKLSMLAMQREAWEQGVAMQALLEWGERGMVVRMAHGAILRIYPDGRLGQVSDNHGVTDPGANGEGILFAAKVTGDPAFKDGAERMLRFFHDVVDNPKTFVETNLSQMLSYTIFRGVKGGWLPKSYLKDAEIMRRAARSKVDDLGYVRDVCGSPTFEAPGIATEGQAFFILMESGARDLGV